MRHISIIISKASPLTAHAKTYSGILFAQPHFLRLQKMNHRTQSEAGRKRWCVLSLAGQEAAHPSNSRKETTKIVELSSLVLCSRGSYLIVHTSFTTHPQVPAQILNFRDGSFSIVERKRQVGKPCRRKVVQTIQNIQTCSNLFKTIKPVFATTKETRWKLYKDTQFQSHAERRTLHQAWQLGLPKRLNPKVSVP